MKILIAPDSFKGSASSEHIIKLLTKTAKKCFPECEVIPLPMADGGEGTLEVLTTAMHGIYETCEVSDPVGNRHFARYGVIDQEMVVIESAEVLGLSLVKKAERNPFQASSRGTGEMVCHVLKQGYKKMVLALGGSATNDGGIGAADALGIQFFDKNGKRLEPIGENLGKIERINIDQMLPELKEAKITIICDVKNPLVGKNGATYVYGPQKGGTKKQLEILESGMKHYAQVLIREFGKDVTSLPGSGAAGGLAVPFLVFGNASMESGIHTILKLLQFEEYVKEADLVVTGEGRVDGQSACGKVLSGIGELCSKYHKPVAVIAGGMGEGAEKIYSCGIDSIMTTVNGVMDMETAMVESDRLLTDAAERMFRFIQLGMKLQNSESKGGESR